MTHTARQEYTTRRTQSRACATALRERQHVAPVQTRLEKYNKQRRARLVMHISQSETWKESNKYKCPKVIY